MIGTQSRQLRVWETTFVVEFILESLWLWDKSMPSHIDEKESDDSGSHNGKTTMT